MRNRRGQRKINFICLNCDHEFIHDGNVEKTVKCPKCFSKELWGFPFNEPN